MHAGFMHMQEHTLLNDTERRKKNREKKGGHMILNHFVSVSCLYLYELKLNLLNTFNAFSL